MTNTNEARQSCQNLIVALPDSLAKMKTGVILAFHIFRSFRKQQYIVHDTPCILVRMERFNFFQEGKAFLT